MICSSCKKEQPSNPGHRYLCRKCSSKASSKAQRRFRGQVLQCVICKQDKEIWLGRTCRACFNESSRRYQRSKYSKLWKWYNELKNKPCTDCDVTFHPIAMDWDHVKGEKTECISILLFSGATKERIMKEIEKCQLVCSNCHRLRTWQRKAVLPFA